MSTKIYSGHRMANLSGDQILKFFFEFREKEKSFLCDSIASDVLERMRWFIVDVMSYDYRLGCCMVDGKLTEQGEDLYAKMMKLYFYHFVDTAHEKSVFDCIVKDMSMEEKLECMMWDFKNMSLVSAFTENTAIMTQRNAMNYISNKITFHPMNSRWIGLFPFGVAEEFLTKLLKSDKPEDIAFVKKYKIEEFGYWSNSERPDNVSAREWKYRKKMWDIALPGVGVPVECGLIGNVSKELTTTIFNQDLVLTIIKKAKPWNEVIDKVCKNLSKLYSYDESETRPVIESIMPSVQQFEAHASTMDNVEDVHQHAMYFPYTFSPLAFAPNFLKVFNERYPKNEIVASIKKDFEKLTGKDKEEGGNDNNE